jgi:hypothetical protein
MYMHEPQKSVLTKLDYILRVEHSSYFLHKIGINALHISCLFCPSF